MPKDTQGLRSRIHTLKIVVDSGVKGRAHRGIAAELKVRNTRRELIHLVVVSPHRLGL